VEDRWLYGWGLGYAAVRSGTLIPPLSLVTNVSETRDPLAVFETEVIEAVATESDCSADDVRVLVRRHQQGMREFPGVDDLLYEWKKYYPYDPVVARTDRFVHVVLFPEVWDEFADRLDLTDAEQEALMAVHDRQARAAATARGDDTDVFADAAPLVVTRP